ncbi:MAG: 2,3-cyclic 3-phosphodiesterase [Chloroflexota bacterium]|jgi:2'-5' RNA ligase|nr:2,3-cyclic 3-phosphodiesterase [Chloroflexota bacterium]
MPADDPERWRVFLAIEIPDAVRQALSEPLEALQPLHESIRINPTERMHLTLHFLGHQPRPVVEQLPSELAGVVSRHHRFGLTAQGTGAFPGIARPRVLWAGISGADLPRLNALQAELGDALRTAGVTVEGERFHPHLTLGRVRRPLKAPERTVLGEWSTRWGAATFGLVPVDRVRLMRSQLGGGPPRYTTLTTFDLQ